MTQRTIRYTVGPISLLSAAICTITGAVHPSPWLLVGGVGLATLSLIIALFTENS